jgi:hypothetical protein
MEAMSASSHIESNQGCPSSRFEVRSWLSILVAGCSAPLDLVIKLRRKVMSGSLIYRGLDALILDLRREPNRRRLVKTLVKKALPTGRIVK